MNPLLFDLLIWSVLGAVGVGFVLGAAFGLSQVKKEGNK